MMKKNQITERTEGCSRFFWLVFLMSAGSLSAQTTVAPTAMNIVYRGVDNPMEVVSSEPLDSIFLEGGTLQGWERLGDKAAQIIVRPDASGTPTLLVIAASHAGARDTSYFRTLKPPMPVVEFAGELHGAELSRHALKTASGISARWDEFDFNPLLRIESYILVIEKPLGEIWEFRRLGEGRFKPEDRMLFDTLEQGSVISFEEIQVTLSGYYAYPELLYATYTVQ
jgi:hypothetical protein